MEPPRYLNLLRSPTEPPFTFINPPFDFNAKVLAQYPPEVTGIHLLNSMCRRLGWGSLAGKRLLDYGCGVRFARTIVNLDMEIGCYTGVDVNRKSISWLQEHVKDRRLRFVNVDLHHPIYNPNGVAARDHRALARLDLADFDAICMFSVVTHMDPDETQLILTMLQACVPVGGALYFTAFVEENVQSYAERDPQKPRILSTYHPEFLVSLVEQCGWEVSAMYAKTALQQTAFVCRKRDT